MSSVRSPVLLTTLSVEMSASQTHKRNIGGNVMANVSVFTHLVGKPALLEELTVMAFVKLRIFTGRVMANAFWEHYYYWQQTPFWRAEFQLPIFLLLRPVNLKCALFNFWGTFLLFADFLTFLRDFLLFWGKINFWVLAISKVWSPLALTST